jgi:hypothetical protein
MGVVLALPQSFGAWKARLKLPDAVPPFNTRIYYIFSAIWFAAFLLAVIGPAAGLYHRYSSPENNSQLMLGSRAGFAVSEEDATAIRFPVGEESRRAGIRKGDDIVAIYGLPLPDVMPVTEEALASHPDDGAYIAMTNLLFGTDSSDVPLVLRAPDGHEREVTVTTGEQHIDAAARGWGISAGLLNFIDLTHVVFYPFLLWAAWILYRRNSRDAVSSILSLAILLTIGAEQPSTSFLDMIDVPRRLHVGMYDLGNVFLLAGILLFPHGKLSPRLIVLLALLPSLLFLHGEVYQSVLLCFMIAAVLMLLSSLHQAEAGDVRQQIRWALFGFTGYAIFRAWSILGDVVKMSTDSFAAQMWLELMSGFSFGMAVLLLQLGLLVALLRFRLYDAEAIISRTASIAIVTLVLGAVFAGVMEGIITQMQNIYSKSQTPAAMIGAVMATMLIHPLHERVQTWAERHFHKSLLELKEKLPEAMRDLRDVASLGDFIQDVLSRITGGVLATRAAFLVGREVKETLGISKAEVLRWMLAFHPDHEKDRVHCDSGDTIFPLRLRVEDGSGTQLGWVLIGPRPDGSVAGKDEREALEDIAVPLARSLRVVITRENEKQELLQLLDAHGRRIETIERQLQISG